MSCLTVRHNVLCCKTGFSFVVWVYNVVICMFVCHTVAIRLYVCHGVVIRLNVAACTTVPTFVSVGFFMRPRKFAMWLGSFSNSNHKKNLTVHPYIHTCSIYD